MTASTPLPSSGDAPQELLAVRGLSKFFPIRKGLKTEQLRALNQVAFALDQGEVVALVGESGSGKSTTARVIARLLEPTSGEVWFKQENIFIAQKRGPSLKYRSQVQMIFQDPFGSLNPVHSIGHHLERPLLRHGKARGKRQLRERVDELLDTVGLSPARQFAEKHPHQTSGGQRQRVAIARALAADPDLILADEPTSMLDVSIRIGVLNLMHQLKEERGIAYLFITHDLASARYFADRTLVMYAGTVVEEAPSEAVMQYPAHPYTKLLLSAVPDPNGDVSQPLQAKSGQPKLIDAPPGCPFAARCPHVEKRCREEMPAAREVSPKQVVRCHIL